MENFEFSIRTAETPRHRTSYLEIGPDEGSLLIFLHGWPELGLVWRAQMKYFAATGWRCVAPDMRGYGGSSVPDKIGSYAISEIVTDMVELHDALGAGPAVWVGHDWGSPIVWSLAAHHPTRCRAVINMCIPYFARGFTLTNFAQLVNRDLYPVEEYPVGQWDYFLFYREHFLQAAQDFQEDVEATINMLYRRSSPEGIGQPAMTSNIRTQGGWFGNRRRAPRSRRDTDFLPEAEFRTLIESFERTGFRGPNAWYLNDDRNQAYASSAPNFGVLKMPALFLHASWDSVCDTVRTRFAEPMRSDCSNLTEVIIEAGHELQIENASEVNRAINHWLMNQTNEKQ